MNVHGRVWGPMIICVGGTLDSWLALSAWFESLALEVAERLNAQHEERLGRIWLTSRQWTVVGFLKQLSIAASTHGVREGHHGGRYCSWNSCKAKVVVHLRVCLKNRLWV
eukprot:2495820-Amphidinium_carterae.2